MIFDTYHLEGSHIARLWIRLRIFIQRHRFSYHLKMGSMQSRCAIYTNAKKIKAAAHRSDDVNGTCKQAFIQLSKL